MKVSALFESGERTFKSVYGEVDESDEFTCSNSDITSLRGSPKKVNGTFWCHNNKLSSLEGGPIEVTADYDADGNIIDSLDGMPVSVGGDFNLNGNRLTSLSGIHKKIKYIGGSLYISDNPLEHSLLGLLRIKGLQKVFISGNVVQHIFNRHLQGDRDIFACQEELVNAGFEDFAKL